jgi:hypothetical protein
MWCWLVIWIAILVFNTVHSFLPNKLQRNKWIRITAMIIATLILIKCVFQEVTAVQNRSYAYVTPDGQITKSNNFPWKITHAERSENDVYFILDNRSDGTDVSVIPDNPTYEPNVYGVVAGVCIKFNCEPSKVPGFKIVVKR